MSRSRGSWLLFFSIASVPFAAYPLGLGDIHVDSDLNQPLTAHIDLVGATAEELAALNAVVANRDAFLRAGAERPAYLSSVSFKVSKSSDGRPVLAIRSSDPFTDPLLSLLVDLRWPHGELIREYTVMLDPADASFRTRLAAATGPLATRSDDATVAANTAAPPAAVPARAHASMPRHATESHGPRRIVANTSLRRLARRAGARGRTDVHRMMLAIYHANPGAFDGSITRLRRGSTIVLPTREQAAVTPRATAEREYQALMRANRDPARARQPAETQVAAAAPPVRPLDAAPAQAAAEAPAQTVTTSSGPAAAVAATIGAPSAAPVAVSAIDMRMRSLEKSIDELKSMLASEHAKFVWLQEQTAAQSAAAPAPQPKSFASAITPVAAVLSFLLGITAALRWRRPADVRASKPAIVPFTPFTVDVDDTSAHKGVHADAPIAMPAPPPAIKRPVEKIVPRDSKPVPGISVEENLDLDAVTASLPAPANLPEATAEITIEAPPPKQIKEATFVYGGDVTAALPVDPEELFGETIVGMENVKLDYNLTDLDTTAQHVQLPSDLNDRALAEEQRTNVADVLKAAIAREPHRRDLQMKLLEIYFAHSDKDAFLGLADTLAQNRDQLTSIDWHKVLMMGRQIAPDEPLFKGDENRSHYAA